MLGNSEKERDRRNNKKEKDKKKLKMNTFSLEKGKEGGLMMS